MWWMVRGRQSCFGAVVGVIIGEEEEGVAVGARRNKQK